MIDYNSTNNQIEENPFYQTANWMEGSPTSFPIGRVNPGVPVGVGHVGGGIPPVGWTPSGGWVPSQQWHTTGSSWHHHHTWAPVGWAQTYPWAPWQGSWIPRYPYMW